MAKDMSALHQDVRRLEEHIATVNEHLDLLEYGYRNARGNAPLRARLEGEIDHYTQLLGKIQSERDHVRREITALRDEYRRRGWRQCTQCSEYKPRDAFGPEPRVASGLNARCRLCRNTLLNAYRAWQRSRQKPTKRKRRK